MPNKWLYAECVAYRRNGDGDRSLGLLYLAPVDRQEGRTLGTQILL